ncbi:MAG: hypothetical protein H7A45_04655 [Verrucomicrobiales bacterium]|nr:hypothetical protein [Verrucomicrobiales bacterium]MCP5527663.1 hypothetical protein [Verrucomicrobiales bacterium]
MNATAVLRSILETLESARFQVLDAIDLLDANLPTTPGAPDESLALVRDVLARLPDRVRRLVDDLKVVLPPEGLPTRSVTEPGGPQAPSTPDGR